MFKNRIIKSVIFLLLSTFLFTGLNAKAEIFLFSTTSFNGFKDKFVYQVKAGDVFEDKLEIVNNNETEANLKLSARDFVVTSESALTPDLSKAETTDTGKWIQLETTNIVVAKQSKILVNFKVKIPADITSGEYLAFILAESGVDTNSQKNSVGTNINKSIKLFFQVNEDYKLSLKLSNLNILDPKDSSFKEESEKLKYLGKQNLVTKFVAENTGNIFGRIEGEYILTQNNREIKKSAVSFDITPGVGARGFYIITNVPYSAGDSKFEFNYKIVPQNLDSKLVQFSNDQGNLMDNLSLSQQDLEGFVDSEFPAISTEKRRISELSVQAAPAETKSEDGKNSNLWYIFGGFLLLTITGAMIYVKKYKPEIWKLGKTKLQILYSKFKSYKFKFKSKSYTKITKDEMVDKDYE